MSVEFLTDAPPPATHRRVSWRWVLLVVAALVLGIAVGWTTRDDRATRSDGFTGRITIQIVGVAGPNGTVTVADSGRCTGAGQYRDIAARTPVSVAPARGGKPIGGYLSTGRAVPRFGDNIDCLFTATITGRLPRSSGYQVTIGDGHTVYLTSEQMRRTPVIPVGV